MDNDILFFFREHMDAPPIYERLDSGSGGVFFRQEMIPCCAAQKTERFR